VGHANGVVRRFRGVAGTHGAAGLAAACVGLLLIGVAGAAQAQFRPIKPASAYQAEAKGDAGDIATDLGHGLGLPLTVVVNTKQLNGTDPAYSYAYDGSGGMSGTPARCTTYINPNFSALSAELQKFALIHEVFHCFEAKDFTSLPAYYAAPNWLIEGEAEWVAATLAPTELHEWDAYLTGLNTSLFARSYDAIGFYAHLTNSGEDTWHLLDPMLKAYATGGSAAAYNVAADKRVRLTWASSLARQSSLGTGWQTTGPGITATTYHPPIHEIAVGTTISDNVAAYTNALVRFQVTTAQVVDISASTRYSRLHTASGSTYDDLTEPPNAFCVSDCTMCPQVAHLPKLTTGVNWLAVTGDSSGATYSIAGAKVTCGPCLVGNWVVTNLTLTTNPGGAKSGGAGTTVEIQPNGDAVGNFTPGGPLVGGGGSVKFDGIDTDHYSFPTDTTARSGSFTASNVSTSLTITEGGLTVPVRPSTTSGSYKCVGTGLTLHFVGGPTTLDYTLVPAG